MPRMSFCMQHVYPLHVCRPSLCPTHPHHQPHAHVPPFSYPRIPPTHTTQALYLPMRLMVVSARDAARAQQERERRQQEAGTPPDTDPISQAARAADTAALETAKELMDALRAKHTNPGLEQLVQELMGSRFVPRAEERLLLVLHVLLQRCYKNGLPDSAEVPAPLKKELANVCRACSASDGAGRAGRMSPSTVLFTERFIKGLIPDGPDFPNTLGGCLLCCVGVGVGGWLGACLFCGWVGGVGGVDVENLHTTSNSHCIPHNPTHPYNPTPPQVRLSSVSRHSRAVFKQWWRTCCLPL